MPFNQAIQDREHDKFVECPTGETAVRVCVANESSDPVQVSGTTSLAAPTGPVKRSVATVTDTAADPIPVPLTNRQSLIIRNRSSLVTIYLGEDNTITADDTSTGGWEIGPQEDFSLDLDESNGFFLKAPAGQTVTVKFLEIASSGSGGGGGGGSLTAVQEVPTGTIDGSNTVFGLSQTPLNAASFTLYLDGVLQRNITHYTRTGTVVTMVTAPLPGQTLDAIFWV